MSTNTTNRRNSNSSDDMSYVLTNTPTPNRAGVNRPRPRRSSTSSNGRMSWIGVPTPPDTSNNNHGRGRRSSVSSDGRMSWVGIPSPPPDTNNLSHDDDMDWERTEETTTTQNAILPSQTTQNAAAMPTDHNSNNGSNNSSNKNSGNNNSRNNSRSSGGISSISVSSINISNNSNNNNSQRAPPERSAKELQSLLLEQKIRWADLSRCDRKRVQEYVKHNVKPRPKRKLTVPPVLTAGSSSLTLNRRTASASTTVAAEVGATAPATAPAVTTIRAASLKSTKSATSTSLILQPIRKTVVAPPPPTITQQQKQPPMDVRKATSTTSTLQHIQNAVVAPPPPTVTASQQQKQPPMDVRKATSTTSTSQHSQNAVVALPPTVTATQQQKQPPANIRKEPPALAMTEQQKQSSSCRGVHDQTDASNQPAESEYCSRAATTDSCITRNDHGRAQCLAHSPKVSSEQMFNHGNSLLETSTSTSTSTSKSAPVSTSVTAATVSTIEVTGTGDGTSAESSIAFGTQTSSSFETTTATATATATITATATVHGETHIPATQAAASASASTTTRTAAAASSSFNSGVGNADSPEETTRAIYRNGKRRRVDETQKSSAVGSNNRTSDVDLDGVDSLPSTPLSDSDSDSEGRESSITASRLVFPPPAAQQQQQQQDDNDDDEMGERSASQYPAFESERRPSMKVTELVPSPSATQHRQHQEQSASQDVFSELGSTVEVNESDGTEVVMQEPEQKKLQHPHPSDDCPSTTKQDSASNPQATKTNSEEQEDSVPEDGVDEVGGSVNNNQANAKENKNNSPLGPDNANDPVGVSSNDNNQVNDEDDDGFPLCPDSSEDSASVLFEENNTTNNEEEHGGFPLFDDNDPLDVSSVKNCRSNPPLTDTTNPLSNKEEAGTENAVALLQDLNGLNRGGMIDDTSCDVSQNSDENNSDDKENAAAHFPPNHSSRSRRKMVKMNKRVKKTVKRNEQRKSGALFITKTSLRSKGVSIPVSNTGTTCVPDALVVCVSEYGRLDSNESSEVRLPNGSMMSGDELTTLLRNKLCSNGWAKVSEINDALKEELGFTAVKMTGSGITQSKATVLNQTQGCFLVVCNLEDDDKNTTTHAIAYVANGEGRFLIDTTAYEQPLKLTPREIVKLSKYDIKKSGIVAKKAKKTARDTAGDVFLQRLHYKNEIACWYEIKPCSGEDLDTNKCQECNFDTAKTANSSGCPTSNAQCVDTSKIDPSVQKGRERNAGCPIVSDQSVDTLKADSLVLLGQDFCHRQTSVVTDVTNSGLYGDGDRSPTNSPPRSSKLNSDMSDDPRRD